MSNIPPPVYAPRDHAQVQPSQSSTSASTSTSSALEFSETTSVCLEWRLSGLRAMYDGSKGEGKSKCIKSAVFGDADNLWEVLWYPNSGVQGGEYASLYLSCVPTAQERDQGIGNKWTRKGLWWFRFEIKSVIDERNNKVITLATKDASDHTFAVKTANWGWQQFAKRDSLFLAPTVQSSDSFLIVCTIQAQPQPPAGYWLGLGLPPTMQFVNANATVNTTAGTKIVGSGGGLSGWSGGEGASGGVAGGTTAAGGVKSVVPRDLILSVGAMLDDQLYSDVEFIIRHPQSRRKNPTTESDRSPSLRRIYANKKLLSRCDYFEAMFTGGFMEVEGVIEDDDDDDEFDHLSDSDEEDEAAEMLDTNVNTSIHLTTTTSNTSTTLPASSSTRRLSTSADEPPSASEDQQTGHPADGDSSSLAESAGSQEAHDHDHDGGASGHIGGEEAMEEEGNGEEVRTRKEHPLATRTSSGGQEQGQVMGPKKTKVIIKDAAWSTWWAVLYWLYTDIIYFAPLSSSFGVASTNPGTPSRPHSRHPSTSIPATSINALTNLPVPQNRREWIRQWMSEHGVGGGIAGFSTHMPFADVEGPVGPRPVSAKAVYRLADKLDLPALKLRAFQHICGGLTAGNIPAEVFSRFSSTFEDVRKVQVAYFLKHWSEIKKSETMTQIWTQIRLGKHVGFEEVWPLIVGQLDFKPS